MKNYKKLMTLTLVGLMISTVMLGGCSSNEDEVEEPPKSPMQGEEKDTAQNQEARTKNQVVGQVTSVLGNEITLLIGEMSEDFTGGTEGDSPKRPEGGTDTAPPSGGEKMTEGAERPSGGAGPNGGTGPATGDRPSGGTPPSGGVAGSAGAGAGMDFSEMVELGDEEKSFSIPVGTVVKQFGTDMTFSQIQEDMYVTISLNDQDEIVSINVLG